MLAVSLPAFGQVTTSQDALKALGPGKSPSHTAHHAASSHHGNSGSHAAASRGAVHHAGTHPAGHAAAGPPPAVPAKAPPAPVFKAPVLDVPLHPPPPPPPVPVVQGATGTASALPDGVRITFGAGSSDLNAATMDALHHVAERMASEPQTRADLEAFSSGTADDPSTPRRLALSRGLAARAVLINAGIPSTRIYVRSIGQPSGSASDAGPADRLDLHLSQNPSQAPATVPVPVVPPGADTAASPTPPGAAGQ